MSVWATVGHGSGEVEIEDAAGTQASGPDAADGGGGPQRDTDDQR